MSSNKPKPLSSILYLVFSIKYSLLILSPIFKFKVIGHSMYPTIKEGEIILVNRFSYLLKRPSIGDIIAAKVNKEILIKRITKIDRDNYFLKGDNLQDSLDSRRFGAVSKKQIIGKVFILNT